MRPSVPGDHAGPGAQETPQQHRERQPPGPQTLVVTTAHPGPKAGAP